MDRTAIYEFSHMSVILNNQNTVTRALIDNSQSDERVYYFRLYSVCLFINDLISEFAVCDDS